MKPEDLVPTRSTCIALKEKGFPQDTFFCWFRGTNNIQPECEEWRVGGCCKDSTGYWEQLPAPTLGEILEQLPQKSVGLVKQTWPVKDTPDYKAWAGEDRDWAENPAEAAARLWIRVKEGR